MKTAHILRSITLKRYLWGSGPRSDARHFGHKLNLGAFKRVLNVFLSVPWKKIDFGRGAVPLANSDDLIALCDSPARDALENAGGIDENGWGLIAPFGEWPKTRVYRENGQVKEQQFIQVLDNEAADALVDGENGVFKKFLRRWVGIPVFKGHGDLNDADPAAVPNEKQKIKLGVVDQIRKTERGIEAHFSLDNDGDRAVTQEGYKFPSAFWWVLPNGGKRGDAILVKPSKLISVALTPHPNISGVESLANARSIQPAETPNNETMLTEKLTGALIGRGITLPANPTEDQLVAAIPNDMADSDDDSTSASAKAHRASAGAMKKGDKDSHLKAAVAHQDAADSATDDDTKDNHNSNARYHTAMAAKC